MPQVGTTFNGQYISLPGAYYADNVQATLSNTFPTPPLLMIGYTYGLKPQTPTYFTTAQNAINAVRGGPLGAFIPFVANPSPSLNGTQNITIIDASSNTQAAYALQSSGATTFATLTTVGYGPPSNLMQVTVASGTLAGLKLTLTDNSQVPPVSVTGDNLSYPFTLAYNGTATGSLSYTAVSGASSGTFTLTSPNAGETFVFPLAASQVASITQLVEAINGTGFWLADLLSATNGQLPSYQITGGSGTLAAVSGGVAQFKNIPAFKNDIPFWVNQFASTYCTAVTGALGDVISAQPITIPPTYFSGATGVPPTTSGYASALNVALNVDAWAVFCDTNTTAVMALLASHCETASSILYGAPRRGFTGSSIGDSVSTTITNATSLNAIQMVYAYPGIVVTSTTTGLPTTYGGLYAAAAAAGIVCGNPIATALTNKPLNGTGLEVTLTSSQQTELQNAGVMVIIPATGTKLPTILSDMTCWQSDSNISNTSSQQVGNRFWLAYTMLNAMQPYVGSIASNVSESVILRAAIRALNALIYTGGTSNGVLNSWNANSLQLVYTGTNQLAAITFEATLVGQNRYITIYVPIQPLNITVTASTAG